jgi:CheY-like chemotaxis protein
MLPEVLVVSAVVEDRRFLRSVFESIEWHVHDVDKCQEARDFLRAHRPRVIVCDWDLPDGSWREILSEIAPLPDPPSLLVTGVVEDSRWSEVLNLGAYDLLAKPLDRTEVVRIASLASLHKEPARDQMRSATGAPH